MSPFGRFLYEYRNLLGVLSASMALRLLGATVRHGVDVVRTRRLTGVDRAMSRDCLITYRGQCVALPLAAMDTLLEEIGDNPTFGNLREMFANDVYLRAFPRLKAADVVVDLGSNRGLFLVIAKRVLGARFAVGIEPVPCYQPVFSLLCAHNAIDAACVPAGVARLHARVSVSDDPGAVSMDTVIARFSLDRIDFLKCDIEGDEYRLFADSASWLPRVRTLAMELHPWLGDNQDVVAPLLHHGFACLTTDRFGHPAPVAAAEFLYASTVCSPLPASP